MYLPDPQASHKLVSLDVSVLLVDVSLAESSTNDAELRDGLIECRLLVIYKSPWGWPTGTILDDNQ